MPVIGNVTTTEEVTKALQSSSGVLYAVYFADWCPDCQVAEPVLKQNFESDHAPKLLRVMVGERAVWKTPTNAFRQEAFKISNIPTLVRYEAGKEVSRLVESQILGASDLKQFLA